MSWKDFYLFLATFNSFLDSYLGSRQEISRLNLAQGVTVVHEKWGFSVYVCENLWEVVMDTQGIKRMLGDSIRRIDICGSSMDLHALVSKHLRPKKISGGKKSFQNNEAQVAKAA